MLYYTENNGKLPHLFISNKTAILVPEFAVKDLPLVRTLWWWWWWLIFGGYISLLKYWWAHPIKLAMSYQWPKHICNFPVYVFPPLPQVFSVNYVASFTSILKFINLNCTDNDWNCLFKMAAPLSCYKTYLTFLFKPKL